MHVRNRIDKYDDMANVVQVAILEDHPVYRSGIKFSLSPVFHVALEADSAVAFFSKIATVPVDVVLLDIFLPDMSGIDVAAKLRSEYPDIKILVLSVDTREETYKRLVEIGVHGFLSKNASEDTLLEAVKTVAGGGLYFTRSEDVLERDILISVQSHKHEALTPRECDIMLAFCKGLSCAEVAEQMFISPKTVDNHKQHIFAKLGIHNMVQLVTYAVRNKIIVLR